MEMMCIYICILGERKEGGSEEGKVRMMGRSVNDGEIVGRRGDG